MAAVTGKRSQIIIYFTLLLLVIGSIVYFNILIQTEQDVLAAEGTVAALMQRRNDISVNLSKAVLDYSKHEQSVFQTVVSLRGILSNAGGKNESGGSSDRLARILGEGQAPAGTPAEDALKTLERALGSDTVGSGAMAAGLMSPLDRLMAVAEQYPDLKLSTNFQSLMTALIEVEKDLAVERIRYNDAVNLYTTTLYKFPTNIFAFIFNFETLPYYEATEDARRFVPIDF